MKIMMVKTMKAAAREDGAESAAFEAGQEYTAAGAWQEAIFNGFVKSGAAYFVGGNVAPTETKKVGRPRKTTK